MNPAILSSVFFAGVLACFTMAALSAALEANKSGFISVRNNCGNVAFLTVEYTLDGKAVKEESGDFPLGVTKTIDIPAGAKDVNVNINVHWLVMSTDKSSTILTRSYPGAVEACFKVFGSTPGSNYREIDCKELAV